MNLKRFIDIIKKYSLQFKNYKIDFEFEENQEEETWEIVVNTDKQIIIFLIKGTKKGKKTNENKIVIKKCESCGSNDIYECYAYHCRRCAATEEFGDGCIVQGD